MPTINIAKDFSPDPIGRYRSDGDSSGEAFREDVLAPMLLKLVRGDKLCIILDDGVEGYGSSFLVEAFAGIVKRGYMRGQDLLELLEFSYSDPDFGFYKDKIIQYIQEAKFNTEKNKTSEQ